MRSYEELEANAYKKAEQIINDSKRKKRIMLRRSTGLTLGAAAIIGLGICANALKPPKKPTAESSGIITETTTVISVGTTVKTSMQTGNATANAVYTSKTTATGVNEKNSATTSVTGTSAKKSGNDLNTTQATITHSKSTSVQSATASSEINKQTASVSKSSTSSEEGTGTTAIKTTAASNSTSPASVTTTLSSSEWFGVYNDDSKTTYRAAWKDNKKISASEDELGDYLGEQVLHLTYYMLPNYVDEECKVYTVKNYSPSYVLAIQSKSDNSPKLCYANAEFKTLGALIDGTNLENTLVLKEAYSGFIDPGESSIGTPELDDFLDILSDTSLKSLPASVMNSSCSYTIKAEIPKLGINGSIILLLTPLEQEKGYVSLKIFGNNCTYSVEREKIESFINKISVQT